MFLALKGIHLLSMTLSVILFFSRGILLLRKSPLLERKFIRTAPYYIDGVLIISAISTAVILGLYPFVDGWATAKILGTLAYLGCVHAGYGARKTLIYWLGVVPLIYLGAVVACRDPLACLGSPVIY